jgi:hypothetical protein
MKIFLAIFVLAVVGGVGWYFYCPTPVMEDFQAAVDSGKPEAITAFMDIPALKKNVAEFVHARYDQKDNPAGNPTPEQVQAMVDEFVTPANILLLMKGVKVEPGRGAPPPTDDKTPHPIVKHLEGPDVYAIDIFLSQVQSPDNMMTLLFERDGWFNWKLAAFRFSWS